MGIRYLDSDNISTGSIKYTDVEPKKVLISDIFNHAISQINPLTEEGRQNIIIPGMASYKLMRGMNEAIGEQGVPAMQKVPLLKDIPFGARLTGDPNAIMETAAGIFGGGPQVKQFAISKSPKIMNDNWIVGQAQNAKKIAGGLEDALGNAYSNIYSKVNTIGVNQGNIDEILLKSDIPDDVLKQVDMLTDGKIDTVEKAKIVADILRKKAGAATFKGGGTLGKGGIANPQIRSKFAWSAVKDEIENSIENVDPKLAKGLKELNAFAAKNVYPKIDKIYSLVGRGVEPSTEGISSVYNNIFNLSKAAQRKTIKDMPNMVEGLGKFTTGDFSEGLSNLLNNSKQLVKDMGKFRVRQYLKWLGAGAGGAGATIGIVNSLRK